MRSAAASSAALKAAAHCHLSFSQRLNHVLRHARPVASDLSPARNIKAVMPAVPRHQTRMSWTGRLCEGLGTRGHRHGRHPGSLRGRRHLTKLSWTGRLARLRGRHGTTEHRHGRHPGQLRGRHRGQLHGCHWTGQLHGRHWTGPRQDAMGHKCKAVLLVLSRNLACRVLLRRKAVLSAVPRVRSHPQSGRS